MMGQRFVAAVALLAASCLAACNRQTSSSLTGATPDKAASTPSPDETAAQDETAAEDEANMQDETAKQTAIKTAVEQLGLPADKVSTTATQSRLEESVIPGLGKDVAGETAWEVQVEGIRIRPPDSTIENTAIRKLAVTICPGTGQVMKIRGPVTAAIPPGPSPAEELAQMQGVGESFSGFPGQAPKITFLHALDKAFGNAANAGEITGYYVLHTIAGSYQDRPVWIIHLRGLPPIPPSLPSGVPSDAIPDEYLNHTRTIVDAQTGEFLIADSIPQPGQ